MTQKKKKRVIILSIFAAIFTLLTLWTIWGNTALKLSTYTVSSKEIPSSFDGYRIAQVSDLHNAEMGDGNKKLITMLEEATPNIIAITGDIIDSNKTDIEIALFFAEEAVKIAPCYYITGNHEAWVSTSLFKDFEAELADLGVTVLHDEEVIIEIGGEQISLTGIDDPDFAKNNGGGVGAVMTPESLNALNDFDGYKILLSHRPEFFNLYVRSDFDLILSGHAHGGQFRLPFIGGLIAPNQGLFPKYDAGVYTEDDTDMIVSRGIGNSIIPIRFNNRPEVILTELKSSAR